ncbi:MAG: hypothetical protein GC162_17980 [Planctomycetes bacterium]|nr:hypothetical protein [Planctomycetota bacterium]
MLRFRCANCDALLGLDDQLAGHKVRCPKCKVAITVPPPGGEPARPASPTAMQAEARVYRPDAPQQPITEAPVFELAHEPAMHSPAPDHAAGSHLHAHAHSKLMRKKRKNSGSMIAVIALLMVVAFGFGYLAGRGYEKHAMIEADRLLPEGVSFDSLTGKSTRTPPAAAPSYTAASSAAPGSAPLAAPPAAAPVATNFAADNERRRKIIGVGFGQMSDDNGMTSLQFWLSNGTQKPVARLTGRVRVFDQLKEHLGDLELAYNDTLAVDGNGVATQTYQLTGPILEALTDKPKDLRYEYEIDTITYADGSSESYSK